MRVFLEKILKYQGILYYMLFIIICRDVSIGVCVLMKDFLLNMFGLCGKGSSLNVELFFN